MFGVSRDLVSSHKRFEDKQGLKITLMYDTELVTIKVLLRPVQN